MSCLLSLINAKHCIVNTLLDFKHIFCIFELLEGSAKQVSDHNNNISTIDSQIIMKGPNERGREDSENAISDYLD
jgi:hypothetical protein